MERRRDRVRQLRRLNLAAPSGMIAAATERRLAGDWRGACRAALVDLEIDLAEVARTYGAGQAARIEAELAGFAPDLMRRFLPRLDGRLHPGVTAVLSRFDEPCRDARAGESVPVLVATLPTSWTVTVRQSVTLRVHHRLPAVFLDLPDWAWHADAVEDRRWAYGGGPDRLPWHFADGTPYPQGWKIPREPAADRPAEVEQTIALLAAGKTVEAFAAFGFAIGTDRGSHPYGPTLPEQLAQLGRGLPSARAELLRLTRRYEQESFRDLSGSLCITPSEVFRQVYSLNVTGAWMFGIGLPPDAELLRSGDLSPDELHPLVHQALLPGRTQHWRGPVEHAPEEIRVRCGTRWHTVLTTGGRVLALEHTEAEIEREFTVDGPVSGCAAAIRGWRTGRRPIPKDVRKDRQDIFALAQHGDTDGLLARLADGLDPELRGPGGGTLLHWLAHLDHERVLPVLLAAGVSVAERDLEGRTALHAAAESEAREVMAALVAAGADTRARDNLRQTPADVLAKVPGR